jgi:hypothetical protein
MNNYWVTNFNPDQKGEHQWSYYLTSERGSSDVEAAQFGWGACIPFLTRVLPGGGSGDRVWGKSLVTNWPENVLLVNTIPVKGENAVFLQIRETGNKQADLGLLKQESGASFKVVRVNAIGEEISGGHVLKPLGIGFFRLSW